MNLDTRRKITLFNKKKVYILQIARVEKNPIKMVKEDWPQLKVNKTSISANLTLRLMTFKLYRIL